MNGQDKNNINKKIKQYWVITKIVEYTLRCSCQQKLVNNKLRDHRQISYAEECQAIYVDTLPIEKTEVLSSYMYTVRGDWILVKALYGKGKYFLYFFCSGENLRH